jgi:hypothetical protein
MMPIPRKITKIRKKQKKQKKRKKPGQTLMTKLQKITVMKRQMKILPGTTARTVRQTTAGKSQMQHPVISMKENRVYVH